MANQSTDLEGQPAFPEHRLRKDTWGGYEIKSAPGLTKRELFAAMAMQGMLSAGFDPGRPSKLADEAANIADAMLTELEAPRG